ncbi:MAG: hypothetical protein ACRDAT_01170, partial [Cetobacterium sp.]
KTFQKYFSEVQLVNKYGIPLENKITIKAIKKLEKLGKIGEKTIEIISNKNLNSFKNYNYSLSIGGECFTENTINKIRKYSPEIVSIKYIFDKTGNEYLDKARKKYDLIYSFEKEDAEKYNLKFRTSFFIDKEIKSDRKLDCYYLGALREDKRYFFMKKFREYCINNSLKYDFKLFLKRKNSKDIYDIKDILSFQKLTYKENIENVKKSKVVVELNYFTQNGLTLRTFECIGAETKLVTENKDICNYDFYNSDNIYILKDEKDIENIPVSFFEKPYIKIDENIKEKYSLDGFIKEIFKIENEDINYEK